MMKEINESNKDKKEGDDLITMENYKAHRENLEGYMDQMIEADEAGKEYLDAVEQEEVKVKMRDGVECSMFVYKSERSEAQLIYPKPAYIYAHGGGAWSLAARHVAHNMAWTCM